MVSGCGPVTADPAFESIRLLPRTTVACPDNQLCVELRADVAGTNAGVGSCALYEAADAEDAEPLATSGDLPMRPGISTTWMAAVPDAFAIGDLNPVCRPMIEG